MSGSHSAVSFQTIPFALLFHSNATTVCNRLCVKVVAFFKQICFQFLFKGFKFPESFMLLGRLLNNLGALYLKLLVPISLFILGSFSL